MISLVQERGKNSDANWLRVRMGEGSRLSRGGDVRKS
jgi:hypothetical protein